MAWSKFGLENFYIHMIQIKARTEYSFRIASGKIPEILDLYKGSSIAGIADRHGTWGHIPWALACAERGLKALLGVELGLVEDPELRERQPVVWVTFIALNKEGLKAIYELTSVATEKFYYHPRIGYEYLPTKDVAVIASDGFDFSQFQSEDLYAALSPTTSSLFTQDAIKNGIPLVACSDNFYPTAEHKDVHEVILGSRNFSDSTFPMHLVDSWELPHKELVAEAVGQALEIADSCWEVELPVAKMVSPKHKGSHIKLLKKMCIEGAKIKKVDLTDPVYAARLDREIMLIDEKKFEDYFLVVADMIMWAKERMLVGPARGSSCGSLVCYLVSITSIDPIPFGLLFERFIDLNRKDLPDIDIDFPDDKRDLVFAYAEEKYGAECVGRLGTVSFFKPKSAITDSAREFGIPAWEVTDLKNAIIERSSGDARAAECLHDTFYDLDIGKEFIKKYPEMSIAAKMEGHARHTGVHAAAILITADPITDYCTLDEHTGAAQLDKKDAEKLDLLKIDALGLRTLSVLQDALDQIGKDREWLVDYPLDDEKAFSVLNNKSFGGIFQFEGYALQSLTLQFKIETFEDIAAVTALARPGPLESGGASEYIKRRVGQSPVTYFHQKAKPYTEITLGIVVYQEQVMQIARNIGGLSWEEVSELRRAMSKSLGKEYFDKFWNQFKVGAGKLGIDEEAARIIWDQINTMGSWAFNRSHAVAYGMISYWCLVLKAHYPFEFAAAGLRHAKDDDQSIKILRELENEGYSYKPYDRDHSIENWSVHQGNLIGGLEGIKGIGPKMAVDILSRRLSDKPFTKRQNTLLNEGVTPWDHIFESSDLWGHIHSDPSVYNIETDITDLSNIEEGSTGKFVIIAKIVKKGTRDVNDAKMLEKRKGQRKSGPPVYLIVNLEDDTGTIMGIVSRFKFKKFGVPIVEDGKVGDWYLWKGEVGEGMRILHISRWKKLTGNPEFAKPDEKSALDENLNKKL